MISHEPNARHRHLRPKGFNTYRNDKIIVKDMLIVTIMHLPSWENFGTPLRDIG